MKNRNRGVTLIELMTAVAVIGVLIAVAIPSFRTFTNDSRTTATTNDLVTALNLARSEALRRASNVVVCASSDQATCGDADDWVSGWIVFADSNANYTLDAGAETVLRAWPAAAGGFVMTARRAGTDISGLAYNTMGMRDLTPGAGAVTFQVVPPHCSGTRAGRTQVLQMGTIQSDKVACP